MAASQSPIVAHPVRIVMAEAILFVATAALGIWAATQVAIIRQTAGIVAAEPITPAQFIASFVVATALLILIPVLLRRRQRIKAHLFTLLFFMATFFGGVLVLSLVLPGLYSLLAMGLLLYAWWKLRSPLLHNLVVGLALAGVIATIGLNFPPETVIILLVLFAVYDFIAVYKTKHMVHMANEMMSSGVILGFITSASLTDFVKPLRKEGIPERFVLLGGGDIVFPLLFAVSVLPVYGIIGATVITIFALLGMMASFAIFILQKRRAPIPALPPIVFASIVGYVLLLLLM